MAANPSCPPHLLDELAATGSGNAIAANPSATPDMIAAAVSADSDRWDAWHAAVENPNCPPEVLVRIPRRREAQQLQIGAAPSEHAGPGARAGRRPRRCSGYGR